MVQSIADPPQLSKAPCSAMLALIFLLCAGFADSFMATAGLRSYAKISGLCNKRSAIYLSSEKMEKNLWDDNVEYVDLNANNVEPSETSRTLPLFLLGNGFIIRILKQIYKCKCLSYLIKHRV